ncbi:S-layer homology domain-containing protein [Evansella sp. AB-rgal1]|uniref:S-layer homology domain-containing protein n=1 Tax=Evansella sp. AB-rgal1 TaxID=3242696 RepID=UPI00359D46ED
MKKYPFSKKAIALMLATAIVATPFAPLTGSVSSQVVSAQESEYVDVSSVVNRLIEIYDYMNNPDMEPLVSEIIADIRASLEDGTINWNLVIDNSASNFKASADVLAYEGFTAELFEALLELFLEANSLTLESKVNTLLDNEELKDGFKNLFPDQDINLQDVFYFFTKMEEYLITENIVVPNTNRTEFIQTTINNFVDRDEKLSAMKAQLKELGLDWDVIANLRAELERELDLTETDLNHLLTGFINGTKYNQVVAPPPVTGTPVVPTPPNTGDEGNISVGNDGVTVERETSPTGQTTVKVKLDTAKLQESLAAAEKVDRVAITVEKTAGERAEVSVSTQAFDAIKAKNPRAIVAIESSEGTINVPVSQIDTAKIKADLGLGANDEISINISVNESTDTDNVVTSNNLTTASPVVEFHISAQAGTATVGLNRFTRPVERSIQGASNFNANTSVVVRLNADGSYTAVPTKVVGNKASFKSFSNSKYVVITNEVSFGDAKTSWANDHITKLGSKLIFKGYDNGTFRPQRETTRAELAVLITRSLGLTVNVQYNEQFKDVRGSEWFVNEVMAAVEYGIVEGHSNGNFAPDEAVTREQAAAMIRRAMTLIDKDYDLNNTVTYANYADSSNVSSWAREDVTFLTQAGLMEGRTGNRFVPKAGANRAEISALLDRFLVKSDFLN